MSLFKIIRLDGFIYKLNINREIKSVKVRDCEACSRGEGELVRMYVLIVE